MRLTVERLRVAIVALAVLVGVIVASALLYGRWRLRHIARDLPGRLGLQIQQSTQGFTLSESNSQGRTLFTLHAARAVKFKSGGRVSLHDVKIDLYNPQDSQTDTISGNEFEFDPQSQMVRSPGEAQIALHLPAAKGASASGNAADQQIQVTTHGLVFSQKTGIATCDGEVDFQTPQASGHAMGAEYDSKQGQLLLKSQLVVTASLRGGAATLHAAQAIYNRNNGHVHLDEPRYASPANRGIRNGSARLAEILLRPNGSMQQMDASGSVNLRADAGTQVQSQTLHLAMGENNQPQQAQFAGGVQFTNTRNGQQTAGRAAQADLRFDGTGHVRNVSLDQAVMLRQTAIAGRNHTERVLTADHVTAALSTRAGQAQMQTANATGNALLDATDAVAGKPPRKTTIAADTLKLQFAANNQMRQLDGSGHTRLRMQAVNGDVDSSTGDLLTVKFADFGGKDKNASSQRVKTAVQTGHVGLQQSSAEKAGTAPQISSATAQRAIYDADADTLTLDGNPRVQDGRLQLAATQIVADRRTGKATASGSVQATLGPAAAAQAGALLEASQPVHVIAEQATLIKSGQIAVFSGRARLWQQQDTIEAPVITFSQQQRTLEAYGNKDCTHCVLSTLAGNAAAQQQKNGLTAHATRPQVFRVLATRLEYADADRRAIFQNDVQVFSADGQLTANQVEVFLAPAPKPSSGEAKKSGSDRNRNEIAGVERIVALGRVQLIQPGRTASGSRLVYTAPSQTFVLTGDATSPPAVNDTEQGSVTGKTITFGAQNQAIMVDGATTTKTRIQKD